MNFAPIIVEDAKPVEEIGPDMAACPQCVREMFDSRNRRYLYPFISCNHCGPRYSVVESAPYDRSKTALKDFLLCAACEAEFFNPSDRRFHAHLIACPDCGPQLALWSAGGVMAERHQALLRAAAAVRAGQIVAVKNVGGFHLLTDARNEESILRLRVRKKRDPKPFAVLFPSLGHIRRECHFSQVEERALRSPAAPIVLLDRRETSGLAPSVAGQNPYLGAMLPGSALGHLFLRFVGFPLAVISGNSGGDPVCTDELEARERLRGLADLFLVHDFPILQSAEDSVVRVTLDKELILRRARGYEP